MAVISKRSSHQTRLLGKSLTQAAPLALPKSTLARKLCVPAFQQVCPLQRLQAIPAAGSIFIILIVYVKTYFFVFLLSLARQGPPSKFIQSHNELFALTISFDCRRGSSFMRKLLNMSKSISKPVAERDYLTTREAAKLLGVALRTVQLWVEGGTLSAWKTVGGHRRITRESVAALLAQQASVRNTTVAPAELPQVSSPAFHVLVVDDDAMTREIMVAMIRSWNFPLTVSTAEDGFAALLYIGETQPDLLLTDLIMPGMDGYRMIRHLRAMPESRLIDIIAITASDVSEGFWPPDIPVITKPVSFAKLRSLIEERLARHAEYATAQRFQPPRRQA